MEYRETGWRGLMDRVIAIGGGSLLVLYFAISVAQAFGYEHIQDFCK